MNSYACGCIGPQRGEPYCPCMMRGRGIFKRDGRWIEPEKDLGPARDFQPMPDVREWMRMQNGSTKC